MNGETKSVSVGKLFFMQSTVLLFISHDHGIAEATKYTLPHL